MARLSGAQRRAKLRARREAVAETRTGLPSLASAKLYEKPSKPDDDIVGSVKRVGTGFIKDRAESKSPRTHGGDYVIHQNLEKEEEIKKNIVQKAIEALRELKLDPDNEGELNRIAKFGSAEEIYQELQEFLRSERGFHEVSEKDEERGKDKIVNIPFGFNDSNPANNRRAQEILEELNQGWEDAYIRINWSSKKNNKRSESTVNRFLVNRREARQGREKAELGEEDDQEDELLEQYHQWKIQGHSEDDIANYQFERENPGPVREEFLPPEPRDMSEPSDDDLPTVKDLQKGQEERDAQAMVDEEERLEEMRRKLSEAQSLLQRDMIYGGEREGSRKAAAPLVLDRLDGKLLAANKRYTRGQELEQQRSEKWQEEEQRAERAGKLLKELEELKKDPDDIDLIISKTKELINFARNKEELNDFLSLCLRYKYNQDTKDWFRIKSFYFYGEGLDFSKDPTRDSKGLDIVGNVPHQEVLEARHGQRYNWNDKGGKRILSFTRAQEEASVGSIRPGQEAREDRRAEKRKDLGRERARREREQMKELGGFVEWSDRHGLSPEEEIKVFNFLQRSGMKPEDLGKKDLEKLGIAAK